MLDRNKVVALGQLIAIDFALFLAGGVILQYAGFTRSVFVFQVLLALAMMLPLLLINVWWLNQKGLWNKK